MSGTLLARVQPIHRGTHDSTKAYETLDIVVNADGTAAYMAAQDVPTGTALTNTDYWEMMVDVSAAVANANTAANNGVRTDTAQELTEAQQAQARANINAPSPIVATAEGETIAVSDASDMPLQGLRIFGKTTQAAEPTPDAPQELVSVGNGGSVGVSVGGKNLLNITTISHTSNGVTITVGEDGSINFAGTAEQSTAIYITRNTQTLPCGNWVAKLTNPAPVSEVSTIVLETYDADWLYVGNLAILTNGTQEKEFEVNDANTGLLTVYIMIKQGATIDYKMDLMICSASIGDKSYEQHKQIQNISIATPNGLPGLPAMSGGNYTDANGQRWICDEIDLARGVYVQRIGVHSLTGSETLRINAAAIGSYIQWLTPEFANNSYYSYYPMCNYLPSVEDPFLWATDIDGVASGPDSAPIRFRFTSIGIDSLDALKTKLGEWYAAGKPLVICGVLASPVETPLSAEELAAYAALHSNYPNTTVLNDAGTHMAVSYAADTQLYIDNKLAELSTAIANNI